MNQDALEFEPGHVVQDTYRIDELLGRGGMGATYKGVNLATQHDVAIKVMHPNFAHDDRGVQLFKRESTLLRDVRHDAVIRYETTLQDRAGRLYLIMELIDGKPLSHYVQSKARLAPEDVLKLGRRLAGGLAAIHALGIVHRDVAPDTSCCPTGRSTGQLIDFGLASDTVNTDQSIIGHSSRQDELRRARTVAVRIDHPATTPMPGLGLLRCGPPIGRQDGGVQSRTNTVTSGQVTESGFVCIRTGGT
jgi:Serine/threonine protein kinase